MSGMVSWRRGTGEGTFSAHKSFAEKDFGRSIVSSASICVRSAVIMRRADFGRWEEIYGSASRLEWPPRR